MFGNVKGRGPFRPLPDRCRIVVESVNPKHALNVRGEFDNYR
jgi:hypothetical protein